MIELLSRVVLDDLQVRPPKHLSASLAKKIEAKASLSVILVSNDAIKKLNSRWRETNAETDVLSFPIDLSEPPAPVPWQLGEIFISVQKASQQAKSYNHSFNRELAFLFVHGMLHLLGFDHEVASEEKEMFVRQKNVLLAAGYPKS
jgi:probable rRNA maturation factor